MRTLLRNTSRLAVVVTGLSACSIQDLVDVKRPSTVLDPAALQTQSGAISIHNGAMTRFLQMFMGDDGSINTGPYVTVSGMMADEYQSPNNLPLDRRDDLGNGADASIIYGSIHRSRLLAGQAISYLRRYATTAPTSYMGNMYAIRGFSELFVAEMFCAGVTLSEFLPNGDVSYGVPLSTEQITQHALRQFDSAAMYGADSTRIMRLIAVGKARAYLNLNQYDSAALVVADVPTDFQYRLSYDNGVTNARNYFPGNAGVISVSDQKGGNGMDYITAGDPRVVIDFVTSNTQYSIYLPRIFRQSTSQLSLASGIEARLAEAEHHLRNDDARWLTTLNALRTTCTGDPALCPSPAPAGSGGIAGLSPLTDPGTPRGQIELLFRERAFWLFSQGHRQGDLRRLVRQYGLPQDEVYPAGTFPGTLQQNVVYGSNIDASPGDSERQNNPNFQGCTRRD